MSVYPWAARERPLFKEILVVCLAISCWPMLSVYIYVNKRQFKTKQPWFRESQSGKPLARHHKQHPAAFLTLFFLPRVMTRHDQFGDSKWQEAQAPAAHVLIPRTGSTTLGKRLGLPLLPCRRSCFGLWKARANCWINFRSRRRFVQGIAGQVQVVTAATKSQKPGSQHPREVTWHHDLWRTTQMYSHTMSHAGSPPT